MFEHGGEVVGSDRAGQAQPLRRREHAQRARWLWSYRLAALDFAQGHYLRAATSLFRLHRTAPTQSLISRLSAAQKGQPA